MFLCPISRNLLLYNRKVHVTKFPLHLGHQCPSYSSYTFAHSLSIPTNCKVKRFARNKNCIRYCSTTIVQIGIVNVTISEWVYCIQCTQQRIWPTCTLEYSVGLFWKYAIMHSCLHEKFVISCSFHEFVAPKFATFQSLIKHYYDAAAFSHNLIQYLHFPAYTNCSNQRHRWFKIYQTHQTGDR